MKGMTYKTAYHVMLRDYCAAYCTKRYPNCKNIECGWYLALEVLRRAMCMDGEQNEYD